MLTSAICGKNPRAAAVARGFVNAAHQGSGSRTALTPGYDSRYRYAVPDHRQTAREWSWPLGMQARLSEVPSTLGFCRLSWDFDEPPTFMSRTHQTGRVGGIA